MRVQSEAVELGGVRSAAASSVVVAAANYVMLLLRCSLLYRLFLADPSRRLNFRLADR